MINTKKIIKSTVYRIYSMTVTMIVSFITTGNWMLAATIGLADSSVKILTYYGFETIWDKFTKTNYTTSLIYMTGLSGSGKTTIAKNLLKKLQEQGHSAMILDGDEIRDIFKNNGFDKDSRIKHGKDVGKMAVYLQSQGIIPIVSLISPYAESRDYVRSISKDFLEVYVSTPLSVCEARDVKGLYKKVRSGEIKDFTGIHDSAPYEIPESPELTINTEGLEVDNCVNQILKLIKK